MEIEVKDKTELSFKAGDILALKLDIQGNETEEIHYYLLGTYVFYNGEEYAYFYLTDIKTGVMAKLSFELEHAGAKRWLSKDVLLNIIDCYEGKVYRKDEIKLTLEKNN